MYARVRGPRACPCLRERELVGLVGGAVEEEDVPGPDRACEEDGGGGVQERAARAERVVGDDELALPAVQRDAGASAGASARESESVLWERERALRRRHGEREGRVRPIARAVSAEFGLEEKQTRKRTHVDVESAWRATWNHVPLSGFLNDVTKAPLPFSVTPGIPAVEFPIQSVFKNWGEERIKIPWRFTSSNLSVRARVSRIDEP